jgi:hypothetical protein
MLSYKRSKIALLASKLIRPPLLTIRVSPRPPRAHTPRNLALASLFLVVRRRVVSLLLTKCLVCFR